MSHAANLIKFKNENVQEKQIRTERTEHILYFHVILSDFLYDIIVKNQFIFR